MIDLDTNELLSILALIVAICSMFVAYQTWKLKKGHKVRGAFYIRSSFDSSCSYISNVILENLKDRDLVIYNIYIKFGRNIYINMLNHDVAEGDNLHIIPGLSTRHFIFGPPYMSVDNSYIVNLSDLLDKYAYKHGKIVLLTSSGRINVSKSYEFEKTPIIDYFKNYGTMDILQYRYPSQSSREQLGGQQYGVIDYSSYGDRVKYVVKLKLPNGHEVEYRIFEKPDDKVAYFNDIVFTKECLESVDSLRTFLKNEKVKGHLNYEKIISIRNLQEYFKEQKERMVDYPEKIVPEGWFQYYICDWLQTKCYQYKEKKKMS